MKVEPKLWYSSGASFQSALPAFQYGSLTGFGYHPELHPNFSLFTSNDMCMIEAKI
ncbi:MAG: hypothetical protein ACREHG_04780 [Candidatus Saccharimonadales bacterium]